MLAVLQCLIGLHKRLHDEHGGRHGRKDRMSDMMVELNVVNRVFVRRLSIHLLQVNCPQIRVQST